MKLRPFLKAAIPPARRHQFAGTCRRTEFLFSFGTNTKLRSFLRAATRVQRGEERCFRPFFFCVDGAAAMTTFPKLVSKRAA